jgi:hypothetical protein
VNRDDVLEERYFWTTAAMLLASLTAAVVIQFSPGSARVDGGSAGNPYELIWPQRWTFYTNLTARPSVSIYKVGTVDGADLRIVSRPAEEGRLWGLNRIGDMEFLLGSRLMDRIPDPDRITCHSRDLQGCLSRHQPATFARVEDFDVPGVWCGTAAVVRDRPDRSGVREIALVEAECRG